MTQKYSTSQTFKELKENEIYNNIILICYEKIEKTNIYKRRTMNL